MLVSAVAFPDFILAIHILGAVIGFGVVFAFPVLFGAATRTDPGVIPWLLRARCSVGRYLVNPGLTFVVLLMSETLYGRFKIFQVRGAADRT